MPARPRDHAPGAHHAADHGNAKCALQVFHADAAVRAVQYKRDLLVVAEPLRQAQKARGVVKRAHFGSDDEQDAGGVLEQVEAQLVQ